MGRGRFAHRQQESHSVWSAWIEIKANSTCSVRLSVALRLECVDRNTQSADTMFIASVALRLECVDRNLHNRLHRHLRQIVALRLECVDRNLRPTQVGGTECGSHSVWSEWIEMLSIMICSQKACMSHSVWSAWIEILRAQILCLLQVSHSVWSAWIEI